MSKRTASEKILRKQRRRNREWLLREGTERMREDDLEYIEANAQSDAPAIRLNIADSLNRFATWYGTVGQIALIDGVEGGWTEIHRSWLYSCLSLRLQISGFQKGRVLGRFRPQQSLALEVNPSALCLAYALVVRSQFETQFFGDALRVMLMDNDVVRQEDWESCPLAPFLVQLRTLQQREHLDDLKNWGHRLAAYQPIIDAWHEPPLLKKAIEDACDFHCERIEDKSDDFVAEFRSPPFDLMGTEILAVYAVRDELGLETPRTEHPLLEAPFDAPIGSPSDVSDEVLERVEASV